MNELRVKVGENDWHTIIFASNGQIGFLDHCHTLNEERVYQTLTGEPSCQCFVIFEEWRNKKPLTLSRKPAWLKKLEKERQRKNTTRRMIALQRDVMRFAKYRLALERIRKTVLAEFEKCSYRYPKRKWAGGNIHKLVTIIPPKSADLYIDSVYSTSYTTWSRNRKYSGLDMKISITLPWQWYHKIYLTGKSIYEGMFVLDYSITEDGEEVYKVACQPDGRSYGIKTITIKRRKNNE